MTKMDVNRVFERFKVMLLRSYGVIMERSEVVADTPVVYITVPETSDLHHSDGYEMSNVKLAEVFKQLIEQNGHHVIVKAKLRPNEHWTVEKRDEMIRREASFLYEEI